MSAPQAYGSPALARLLARFPDAVHATHAACEDATASVEAGELVAIARALRDDTSLSFEMLSDLCGVDHHPAEPRFELVYHFRSIARNHRLRIKATVSGDAPALPSLVEVYPAAEWLEREVFDLFGVVFRGHPDLRRILLDAGFAGHPLRKDFPRAGRGA